MHFPPHHVRTFLRTVPFCMYITHVTTPLVCYLLNISRELSPFLKFSLRCLCLVNQLKSAKSPLRKPLHLEYQHCLPCQLSVDRPVRVTGMRRSLAALPSLLPLSSVSIPSLSGDVCRADLIPDRLGKACTTASCPCGETPGVLLCSDPFSYGVTLALVNILKNSGL